MFGLENLDDGYKLGLFIVGMIAGFVCWSVTNDVAQEFNKDTALWKILTASALLWVVLFSFLVWALVN